ncbi:1-aminocyclopropane-1-carboxylate deaminase/D-cysteine desulfhydrase [Dokdonia sinensis]|uniref:1-aminocyclopropane-1-carboxylate deaminase/D-cysteine desulfhydrase n=1 Tax=Dokdonia sinensis TaxID=2479847 RepID=A0A3M0GF51_9FLAO|nr:pyridoxal-phosphate dependent enzyme [Dokdonia sinensis]RMB62928.1 1-aminocyclopropane-1-carboxylate deaminase/D-cysteine desulfhydrase [Dokdonia sinensis]
MHNQILHYTNENNIEIWLKREDEIHPYVSGNKFRKLKYNIAFAKEKQHTSILTFGGAYSNHIAAVAAAGQLEGFNTTGIIRGEELGNDINKTLAQNPTLAFARHCGMRLHFVSRESYRDKNEVYFRESVISKFDNPYIIPEGGTNDLAVKGCEEILSTEDERFDYVCCAVGTGGTIAGIINTASDHQNVLGFPALKGEWIKGEIQQWSSNTDWKLIADYHFGGYAKINRKLVSFINDFKKEQGISLDPIYTGKMMYGIFDLISQGYFPQNSRILAIHTGGLQGIAGMNKLLNKKGLPLIEV